MDTINAFAPLNAAHEEHGPVHVGPLLPVSVMRAVAPAFLPVAVSLAASVRPAAVKAYRTATVHDFRGPRLVPVQRSAVLVNPAPEAVRAAEAEPPEFLSVNVCDFAPEASVPKS